MNVYNGGSDILIVLIEDCTGRKISSKQKVNLDDVESVIRMFKQIIDKYGMNIKLVKTDKLDFIKEDIDFKW